MVQQAHPMTLADIDKHDIVRFTWNGTEYKGEVMAIKRLGGFVDIDVHDGTSLKSVQNVPRGLSVLYYGR